MVVGESISDQTGTMELGVKLSILFVWPIGLLLIRSIATAHARNHSGRLIVCFVGNIFFATLTECSADPVMKGDFGDLCIIVAPVY